MNFTRTSKFSDKLMNIFNNIWREDADQNKASGWSKSLPPSQSQTMSNLCAFFLIHVAFWCCTREDKHEVNDWHTGTHLLLLLALKEEAAAVELYIVHTGFCSSCCNTFCQTIHSNSNLDPKKCAHITVMLIYLNYNLTQGNHIAILCLAYLKIMTLLPII